MASSSSDSSLQGPMIWKYDVFLSFRGKDTRKTFTSHLYEGLKNRGVFTFQDDKRLEHGESISEELGKAIEESQVAVIIFSKNYASSRWCLDELVKIMQCKSRYGQIVIPVFYDVDPSEVRNQRESFAEALAKHEARLKDDAEGIQKVQKWRIALTEVADLKGCDVRGRVESDCLKQIVDQASIKLCKTSLSYLQDIVGINAHLENVMPLLEIGTDDVRIVGIWGMGGVGKTTIARAIFDTVSYQFEAACFLADIKENGRRNQLHSLQNTLLSEILRRKDDYINNKELGKCKIMQMLCSKKVLIVLDDIDHKDHLDYLAGDLGWFGNGSRVVVTTRDRHLIEKDYAIYEMTILHDTEAMQLFTQHAFKREVPDERFKKLSLAIVNHAKGLPLALKVWGSLLHKRGLVQWSSFLNRIKKCSSSEIIEKLKISYDSLEPEDREIFLDIACFYRGYEKEEVMQKLESSGFQVEYGLNLLIEKSLVYIAKKDTLFISKKNTIEMHDLIQDMGKYVVNMQKDPGERSRLWLAEDIKEVLINDMGTKVVEVIEIDYLPKIQFSQTALKSLNRLRVLCIKYGACLSCREGSIEYLSNNLRWFVWRYYPSKSLPSNFEPKKLVHLELRASALHHLWMERKHLPSLRKLDLKNSQSLMSTPDFTGMPNLEYLFLGYCSSLEEIHDSLGSCSKLICLDLTACKSLRWFPCVNVESLKYLYLHGCISLEKFPEICRRMEFEIHKQHSGRRELPSYLQYQTHITKLNLSDLKNLVALPNSISSLKSLVRLYLWGCSRLETLPEEIGDLENLEELNARNTLISQPPPSIVRLNKLNSLIFSKHELDLCLKNGVCFVFPPVAEGLSSLEYLDLSYCNLKDGGLPGDIGCLSSLKKLHLRGNNFEYLPRSIGQLGALQSLDLSDCKRLKETPDLTGMSNLETLNLSNCMNLEEVHYSLGFLENLFNLQLTNCTRLKRFPGINMESLVYLNLVDCSSLEKFPEILGRMRPGLRIYMSYAGIRELPSSIQYQTHITRLDLSHLHHLVSLPSSIGMLKSLLELDVSYCSKLVNLPEAIGDLKNLMWLDAGDTLISQPPPTIVRLDKLKLLSFSKQNSKASLKDQAHFLFPLVNEGLRSLEGMDLSYCNIIDGGLPEDIGCLSSLKELYLIGNNFKQLPGSITQLGTLLSLDLTECNSLAQLPEIPPQLDVLYADRHIALKSIHNLVTKRTKLQRVIFTPLYDKDDLYYDLIFNSFPHYLFQNISFMQYGICASNSLAVRVFTIMNPGKKIPSWFHCQGMDRWVSINLPENWYACNNFLGFAICYSGSLTETTAQLIPLCHDETLWMSHKLALSTHSKSDTESMLHFFLVPLAALWDASEAKGKTPNNYGVFRLFFSGEIKRFGIRLLYKDEHELEASFQMRENNDEQTKLCIGARRSRYDNREQHDSMTNEVNCPSYKKQRSLSHIRGSFGFEKLMQQEGGSISSETLHLFPTNLGF